MLAWATFDLWCTVRIFANKLALGLGALWFSTFPVTLGFFAYCLTLRLGSLAMSYTMRGFADCNTLWAVVHFAAFIWALNFALWFLAFDIADSILGFGA